MNYRFVCEFLFFSNSLAISFYSVLIFLPNFQTSPPPQSFSNAYIIVNAYIQSKSVRVWSYHMNDLFNDVTLNMK